MDIVFYHNFIHDAPFLLDSIQSYMFPLQYIYTKIFINDLIDDVLPYIRLLYSREIQKGAKYVEYKKIHSYCYRYYYNLYR